MVGLLGSAFDVIHVFAFKLGLSVMMGLYFFAGMHAGWFMGNHVNKPWGTKFLDDFQEDAFNRSRRLIHHWLYWAGFCGASAVCCGPNGAAETIDLLQK